jgi:aspartate carbamoyltransferase catalytic subunit
MKLKNITSADQFSKKDIQEILTLATKIKSGKYNSKAMSGKIMATLFYEPSTRTRLSFESSMLRLGGAVITTEDAKLFSSAAKGETLEDTIRIVHSYADVIVLRHFDAGASDIALKYSRVPIINAGDGNGEHPTQALLDLFTIFSKFNSKDLTICMIGDLANGRTVHSLSRLIALYPSIKLIFVSPRALSIPNDLRKQLKTNKIVFTETEDFNNSIKQADVVYQTRIQKERFSTKKNYLKYFGKYIINTNTLKILKNKAIIMHPLPRVNEITKEVDSDHRAVYFEEAQNGVYVRMALLALLFDKSQLKQT